MNGRTETPVIRQVPIVCPGHSRPLAEVHYSPKTSDGIFLVSACHDKLPMLRRGETGDWIGTFEGHKGAVWSAKLDQTAQRVATASADFSVKLWNAVTGAEIHTFAHKHVVKTVDFSLDGKSIFTGGNEKILRIFSLENMESEPQLLKSESNIRKVVCLNNKLIATGEIDGNIRIWDITSGKESKVIKLDSDIMDMEVSRDGLILTVCSGNQVYFFNIKDDFQQVYSYTVPISFKEEGGASLHPTKNRFIAGGSDTWVRVFNYDTGEEIECHKGHHGPVRCLRYAPDGQSFATGSEDGTIRIWQTDAKLSSSTSNS